MCESSETLLCRLQHGHGRLAVMWEDVAALFTVARDHPEMMAELQELLDSLEVELREQSGWEDSALGGLARTGPVGLPGQMTALLSEHSVLQQEVVRLQWLVKLPPDAWARDADPGLSQLLQRWSRHAAEEWELLVRHVQGPLLIWPAPSPLFS